MSNDLDKVSESMISEAKERLPEGYPGNFDGFESGLRQAVKAFKKTVADIARWEQKQADDKKRDEYKKEQAIKREKEIKISEVWHHKIVTGKRFF